MISRKGRASIVPAVLWLLAPAGCGGRPARQPVVETTPAGFERVRWQALPGLGLDVGLVAEWDLWSPSAGHIFNDVRSVDGEGMHFVLLDAGNRQVVVMNAGGGVEWVTSREGSGPGELRSPTGLDVREGRVWVADVSNRRFSIFDAADGRFLSDVRWPGSARIVNPFRVLGGHQVLHGGSWPLTVGELARTEPMFYLARFDLDRGSTAVSEQGVADTLMTVPAPPYHSVPMFDREGGSRLPYFGFPAFSYELHWDARRDTVVTVSGPEYRFEVRDPTGQLLREVVAPTPHLPVTARHRAWFWEHEFPRLTANQEPYEPSGDALQRFPFSDRLPAIGGITLDQQERVWVLANLPEPGRTRLDVWTVEGAYLGSAGDLPLPAAFLEDGSLLVRTPVAGGPDRFTVWRLLF